MNFVKRDAILREINQLRGDILTMTTLSNSGHPGGSLSSIDMLYTVYLLANIDPKDPYKQTRDRIVVSNGHISPAVYSALGRIGFFDIDEAISTFRLAGSLLRGILKDQYQVLNGQQAILDKGFLLLVEWLWQGK